MNVLFLSPNFPPQFHLFCRALRDEGLTALGIGDSPPHDVNRLLAEAVAEYLYLRDLNQYDDVLRAVGYLTWRHGKIDRIDSLNEHWLPLEARLREDFNVEGPRPAETRRHRSKTGMREIFTAAGVPCTEGEPVTTADRLRAYARVSGYPLVLKPDTGVGAWSTFKVSNEQELEVALRNPLQGYVVERFARGELISYDGLADREGRVVFETSHRYSTGVMDVVNQQLDVSYYNLREIPPRLRELGLEVVKAFGVRERFFHIEFFEHPPGDFRALEINIRPPGGFTTDMMKLLVGRGRVPPVGEGPGRAGPLRLPLPAPVPLRARHPALPGALRRLPPGGAGAAGPAAGGAAAHAARAVRGDGGPRVPHPRRGRAAAPRSHRDGLAARLSPQQSSQRNANGSRRAQSRSECCPPGSSTRHTSWSP